MDLGALRESYELGGIDASELDPDPIVQFGLWFTATHDSGCYEPNAMTMSSVDGAGFPTSRNVLLKGVDERGFVFFTNYESAKSRHVAARPQASLTFSWLELHRQVRIVGMAERISSADSDAYFAERPRGSQIGAWASPQSEVIEDRAVLERSEAEVIARFGDGAIPRPDHWGGIRVKPDTLEFWQGRVNRLHDRLRYRREAGSWIIERLAP